MTRINYTGRRRIEQSDVQLRVRTSGDNPILDVVSLQLEQFSLPSDARVIVEGYRETVLMRFGAGTVGALELPLDQPLSEFDSPEVIRFRVKVVGVGVDEGKILAAADRLRATAEDEELAPHSSLLSAAPEELGHVLWRVSFGDDEPKLLVNRQVGDWKSFAVMPQFSAFVLPEAFRQITAWVLNRIDSHEEGDGSPLDQWVLMLSALGHDPRGTELSDEDERSAWIDEVVGHFSRKFRFLDLVADLTGGGD
jgi:hypothetical protein